MRYLRNIVLYMLAGMTLAAGLACASSGSPSPQPTGPYSTAGLTGPGCHDTGPGWITVPQGDLPQATYQVRDVRYCTTTVGGAVTLASGKRFSEYDSFSFSKDKP